MIFLTGTKCKIRFIYIRFKCKIKNGVENEWKKLSLVGGGRLMAKVMTNFHFFWSPPLKDVPLYQSCSFFVTFFKRGGGQTHVKKIQIS